MGEHRQQREVVQAETDAAAPAVGGAVEAREGDGEEERAGVSREKPPGGLEGEHVGSETFGDVGGGGVDVLEGPARGFLAVPDALDGLDGVDHAAVLVEGSEVARSLDGLEVVHESLVGFGARHGGRGRPAPGFEDRRVRGGRVLRAGDGDDVNGVAAVTEGFPEGGVGGHPGADPVGLETEPTTRIGIDECGRGSATGDGEVEGEVAARQPVGEGTAIDAVGKDGEGDSEALEVGQLLGLRGEPVEVRVLEDVVEGEQPPYGDFRGRAPAMAVVLDPEGAVERTGANVANAGGPVAASVREPGFAGDPGLKKCPDESARGLFAEAVASLVLTPGEDAGVEADEGEPIGFALRPAEAAKGRGAFPEGRRCGGGGRDGHGAGRAVRSGRQRSVKIKRSSSIRRAGLPCPKWDSLSWRW